MTDRLRLLLVINSSAEGGGARHLATLVDGLDRRMFIPAVATTGGGPLVERLARLGVPVAEIPMMRSRWDPRPVARLRRLVRGGRFDLVHLHGTRAGFFGVLALATLRRPPRSIYTIHGLSCSRRGSAAVQGVFAGVERLIASRVDQVISVSETDRRLGVERRILPSGRTVTIPNGVDLPRLEPAAPFGGGRPRVITVARLVPQKGIGVLLNAARLVRDRRPDVDFTIVGDGPARAQLEATARRLGLEGAVSFAGARQGIADHLGAFDLFVLPSLWEGMSFALLEAMAAARPVIASAVSGSRELLADGAAGCLVPPGDPTALAGAILRMASDPETAAAMGSRARERVRREFPTRRMVASTVSLYLDVLDLPRQVAPRAVAGAGR